MKRLLNTLFITSQNSYLSRDGDTVQVSVDNEKRLRVPIHTLESIVCFGNTICTPALLGLCASRKVSVIFLGIYGRFLARVQGPVSGNVLLRREQYRKADNLSFSSELARAVIVAKIANSRTVLMRAARERDDDEIKIRLHKITRRMSGYLDDVKTCESLDIIRGIEGMAAREYFNAFDDLIKTQKDEFYFKERSRRPPLDRMNALMSFYYTLMVHDIVSALETVGLDPAVGFLHRDRPGRPGLALDMVEEFRPIIADRLALSLVNRKQLKGKDFQITETGAVHLSDDARKTVLVEYQNKKQEELKHPFLNEKLAMGLFPHAQAILLARFIRGELDGYPPFLWK